MKVYIVVNKDRSRTVTIYGVFSTRRLAELWIAGMTRQYGIIEMTVDAAKRRASERED